MRLEDVLILPCLSFVGPFDWRDVHKSRNSDPVFLNPWPGVYLPALPVCRVSILSSPTCL